MIPEVIFFSLLFQANEDVTQIVEVLPPGPAKWTWLIKRLVEMTTCKY